MSGAVADIEAVMRDYLDGRRHPLSILQSL